MSFSEWLLAYVNKHIDLFNWTWNEQQCILHIVSRNKWLFTKKKKIIFLLKFDNKIC